MQPFSVHQGLAATLDRSNVDTDQIIPKQFLFFDWRLDARGLPLPQFELNRPEFAGASILVSRRNFGSGSSREHAVWALADYGFRCVIAESFADIFYNNSFKNGLLPVVLPADTVQAIFAAVARQPGYRLTVDLRNQTVTDAAGLRASFDIDPHRRHCLLSGLDDIGLTLQHVDKIARFEQARGYPPASA
jgi:3-isopropylmalate/(R)-2-methylmalate dehydratase small subunit